MSKRGYGKNSNTSKGIRRAGGGLTAAQMRARTTNRRVALWQGLMSKAGWELERHGEYRHKNGVLVAADLANALFAQGRAFTEGEAAALKLYGERLGAGEGAGGAINIKTFERWAMQCVDGAGDLAAASALAEHAGEALAAPATLKRMLKDWREAINAVNAGQDPLGEEQDP